MQEFDSIKVSTYEAEKLAEQLTERSAAGWTVAGIVGAGSDVVAYLSREAGAAAVQPAAEVSTEPVAATSWGDTSAAAEPAAAEPAGWGSVPAEPATAEPAPAAAEEPAGGWGSTTTAGGEWGTADTGAGDTGAPADTGQGGAPAVPPGWFTDPAGRFDLRYWDGNQWTEHVVRGGQQHTDPPVA